MSSREHKRPLFPQAASGDQNGFWLTRTLQQAEVLLLAVLGFLFCLTSSYQLEVSASKLVWSALAFCALFLVIFSSRRRKLLLLICFLVMALWSWRNAQSLSQGLLLLFGQALDPLGLRLPDVLQNVLQTYSAEETVTLTLLALRALLFVVTLFSAYFIVLRPSTIGLAVSTLPLLLPAPFYLLSPGIAPFFCIAAALLMLYIQTSAEHMPARILQTSLEEAPPALRQPLFDQRQAQQMLALFALPIIILAALVSSWILPQDGYQRPEFIEALQDKIFSLKFGEETSRKSNDGLTHGDFRVLSDIRFSGETAIQIRVSKQQVYYLRDYAGVLYTQSGWEDVSNRVYENYAEGFLDIAPQNLLATASAASQSADETYTLSVKYVSAAKTSMWTPCGLVTRADEISGASFLQDTAMEYAAASGADYTIEALPCSTVLSSVSLNGADETADALRSAYLAAAGSAMDLSNAGNSSSQQALSAAQAYIDYIFETYTALPDDTRLSAEQICAAAGLSLSFEDGSLNLYDTCLDLHSYLTNQCSYSYSPPDIPSGADFAIYFLEQSRLGYCVHFASAATVLLRSLGIPARYAEGYIIVGSDYDKQPDDEGYIDIEDTHAHAWVEVFDPVQLEWIPVEMTASAIRSADTTPEPEDENTDTPSPSETPSPEPTATPTPEPTVTPEAETSENPDASSSPDGEGTPEETPSAASEDEQDSAQQTPTPGPDGEDDAETDNSATDGDDGAGAGESSTSGLPLWPLLVILGIAVPVLGAFGWRKALQARRRRLFFQRDANAAVLAICRYVLDMLRFAGCEPMQSSQLPEDYAYIVARRLSWVDRSQLEALLELAQRARFSDRIASRQDRGAAASFAAALAAGLRARLPRLRRWLFYWLYPPV